MSVFHPLIPFSGSSAEPRGAEDSARPKERIEAANQRWREQRFAPVQGETEFIPLPER